MIKTPETRFTDPATQWPSEPKMVGRIVEFVKNASLVTIAEVARFGVIGAQNGIMGAEKIRRRLVHAFNTVKDISFDD
jgi:uncharacterized membrane protein